MDFQQIVYTIYKDRTMKKSAADLLLFTTIAELSGFVVRRSERKKIEKRGRVKLLKRLAENP